MLPILRAHAAARVDRFGHKDRCLGQYGRHLPLEAVSALLQVGSIFQVQEKRLKPY